MSKDNIVSLVSSIDRDLVDTTKEKSFIKIIYSDGTEEVVEADSVEIHEDLPSYITLVTIEPYSIVGFYNNLFIRKIELLKNDNSESN